MADIFRFTGESVYKDASVAASQVHSSTAVLAHAPIHHHRPPRAVLMAVQSVRTMMKRGSIAYSEIAVPPSLGDYGIGVAIEDFHHCTRDICPICGKRAVQSTPASGWVLIAYRDVPVKAWHSHWRCVAGATLPMIAHASQTDTQHVEQHLSQSVIATVRKTLRDIPMLPSFDQSLGGTVSVVRNTAFGTVHAADISEPIATVELRVSWTPKFTDTMQPDAASCIDAWVKVLLQLHTQRMGIVE